jgi:hypothetical protein
VPSACSVDIVKRRFVRVPPLQVVRRRGRSIPGI